MVIEGVGRGPTFGVWLREQVELRYRTQSEFAETIGKSTSAVSRWLNDKELPKPAQCQLIARAIDQPEGLVLERAGHLVPMPEEGPSRPDGPRALLRQALALLDLQAGARVTTPVYDRDDAVAVLLEDGAPLVGLPPGTVALVDRRVERRPDALLCVITPDGRPRIITVEAKVRHARQWGGGPGGLPSFGEIMAMTARAGAYEVLGVVTSVHVPAPLPVARSSGVVDVS